MNKRATLAVLIVVLFWVFAGFPNANGKMHLPQTAPKLFRSGCSLTLNPLEKCTVTYLHRRVLRATTIPRYWRLAGCVNHLAIRRGVISVAYARLMVRVAFRTAKYFNSFMPGTGTRLFRAYISGFRRC